MKIHWLAFTVHSSYSSAVELWEIFFRHSLGDLISTDRRGRGFDKISVALNEAKLYYSPIVQAGKSAMEYYHIELPGSACDALHPHVYRDVFTYLINADVRYSVTRLDLAWDNAPFEPYDFAQAIVKGWVISLAKRHTLSYITSPFQERQAVGDASPELGCDTCYFGSRESDRFIRVYNERGHTRVELVCKDIRAQVVLEDLIGYDLADWNRQGKSHLGQYIRFQSDLFVQWHEFMGDVLPADIRVSSARVVSVVRMKSWFERQVSVAMSVYFDVWGEVEAARHFKILMKRARHRDRSRYDAVLQLADENKKAGASAFARHVQNMGFSDFS